MPSALPIKQNNELSFKFNIPAILLACVVISYGYFGALGNFELSIQIPLTLTLIALIVYLAYNWLNEINAPIKEIRFSKIDALGILIITTFWLTILLPRLNEQITGDQLFYSMYSQTHAIYLSEKLGGKFNFIKNIKFSTLLQLINILMVIATATIIRYIISIKSNKPLTMALILIIFLALRVIVIKTGGGNSPHPPLQLVPLFASSSIFGYSDFSFRLPQMLGLILISYFIFRNAIQILTPFNAILIALATPSIPLLLNVTTLVEGSIWTTLAWSITLLVIATKKQYSNIDWTLLFSLISIATLMRQSAFIAAIPLVIIYIYTERENRAFTIRKLITVISPTFIFLPFLLKSILLGTPATYQGTEAGYIPNHASTIWRVYYAFSEGIAQWVILSTASIPWLIMSTGCLLILQWNRKSTIQFFATLSLLFIAIFMFYSVRPILWGMDRYQSEYIIPFVVMGTYLLFVRVLSVTGKIKYILSSTIVAYLSYGIFSYITNDPSHKYSQSFKDFSIQGEQLYDYSSALVEVKDAGHAGKALIVGSTYGVLPEIMAGYSVNEILMTSNSRRVSKTFLNNPTETLSNDEITILLLSDVENQDKSLSTLKNNGWKDWKMFTHPKSNNTIYGLIRNN
jgi:hypothetical protein